MSRSRRAKLLLVLAPLTLAPLLALRTAAAAPSLIGVWAIERVAPAPWEGGTPGPAGAVGRLVSFTTDAMVWPKAVSCREVGYEALDLEPAALFQGGLPAGRAGELARTLGLPAGPVKSVQLKCDAGLFDFHFVSDSVALVALDNTIYELHRRWQPAAD